MALKPIKKKKIEPLIDPDWDKDILDTEYDSDDVMNDDCESLEELAEKERAKGVEGIYNWDEWN